MSVEFFENQFIGYSTVLGALEALTKEICKGCINLEGARTKVEKGLKKLGMDLEAASIPCEKTNGDFRARLAACRRSIGQPKISLISKPK